jgi:hypothetical protein
MVARCQTGPLSQTSQARSSDNSLASKRHHRTDRKFRLMGKAAKLLAAETTTGLQTHAVPLRQREADQEAVRGPETSPMGTVPAVQSFIAPADRYDTFVLPVAEHMRVISDALQWIVQVRKGKPDTKSSGWRSRKFCRSREGLQVVLRQLLGRNNVPADLVAQIERLPVWHHEWIKEGEQD